MASNGRRTRSKGPSDGVSLPQYSRPRKNVCTETGKQESMTNEPRHQAYGHSQLQDAAERALPLARPSSQAGTSTTPANATQTPGSPFARPGSRAGSTKGLMDNTNIQGSPLSSVSSTMSPQNINTPASSDLIDTDIDAEVANFAGQPKKPQEPLPSTSGVKDNNHALFQPIAPAYTTPAQYRDQALFNSSLNLIDDSPRPQISGSANHISQPCTPHTKMPPIPYVPQATVNQHMDVQPAPVPHGVPTGMEIPQQQQHPSVGTPPHPTNAQPAPLPFVQTSPVDTRTKSKNGQGIKQSKNLAADKPDVICWRCKQPGHLKCDCPMPPFCVKCRQEGHLPYKSPQQNKRNDSSTTQVQTTVDPRFSNIRNKCIHCGGEHKPALCPMKTRLQTAPSSSSWTSQTGITSAGKNNPNAFSQQGTKDSLSTIGSTPPTLVVNNWAAPQGGAHINQVPQVTPQVSPNTPNNLYNIPPMQNQFAPPAYFPIPFPRPPIAPSNVSAVPSAPASDLSAAITLMTNAVNQGNSNMTAITDALQKTTSQFADALQKTIQMGVDTQADETRNARLDKQFDKIKIFDGSNPADCHPWLEEVHALCTQTGRPFREMLLLCAGQAVRDFITDMSLDATDDQIKNDLITGYSDLQGLSCKQAAYNNISQQSDEPLRSYIVRYSRLFKLLNGTAPNEVVMRTTSMHFVNSLRSYLSSKVENRLLGMNERNYSLGDTFRVALECELKAIASER